MFGVQTLNLCTSSLLEIQKYKQMQLFLMRIISFNLATILFLVVGIRVSWIY